MLGTPTHTLFFFHVYVSLTIYNTFFLKNVQKVALEDNINLFLKDFLANT